VENSKGDGQAMLSSHDASETLRDEPGPAAALQDLFYLCTKAMMRVEQTDDRRAFLTDRTQDMAPLPTTTHFIARRWRRRRRRSHQSQQMQCVKFCRAQKIVHTCHRTFAARRLYAAQGDALNSSLTPTNLTLIELKSYQTY
jgi:hypothetical protein